MKCTDDSCVNSQELLKKSLIRKNNKYDYYLCLIMNSKRTHAFIKGDKR